MGFPTRRLALRLAAVSAAFVALAINAVSLAGDDGGSGGTDARGARPAARNPGAGEAPSASSGTRTPAGKARANDGASPEERAKALERLRDAAAEYSEEVHTVTLEADDAVSACEKSPPDRSASGGQPRFLEAKRARTAFGKEVQRFVAVARKLEAAAKAPMPEGRQEAVQALVRAVQADVRAINAIKEYLGSRGDDKHQDFSKARAKLTSMTGGELAAERRAALAAVRSTPRQDADEP
jgi:hypothetical protein